MSPYELLLDTLEPTILDHHHVPPRPERLAPPPASYGEGTPIGEWLRQMTNGRDPWSHQSKSLQLLDEGRNVVTATGTGSGKTLPMQAAVIRELLASESATFFVFCPQKSLTSDQTHRWSEAFRIAGLDPQIVGEINGNVRPGERADIIARARVLIVTQDIVHAYMMRQLAAPVVQQFICNLKLIVIDEAHQLEGVFGSNCAYFFRRLRTAYLMRREAMGLAADDFQVLAASATIADPAEHLKALTGLEFEIVAEADNGAPFHGLHLLHIEGPDHGAAGEALLVDYVGRIADVIAPDAAIAFFDDRQGVERAAAKIGRDDVEPYRAGLETSDRAAIEESLRAGKLAAVVATSALELGVDIPQFTVALNLGVPQSRRACRQRGGRAGRASEAVFALIAPAPAFAKLGTSLREFYEGAAEASPLYLGNRIIQYQQACCLLEEIGLEDGQARLPDRVEWPEGFGEALAIAAPGAPKPPEIEHIASQASGTPDLDFALRKIGDLKFALRLRGAGDELGTIDGDKALREAYPGAVFYQRKKAYRVSEWRQTSYERSIYLEPVPQRSRTSPILLTRTGVSHRTSELQEGNLLEGEYGSLAEIRLQVHQSVIGYSYGGKEHLYRDLSKNDPRKCHKQRNYSTTGVVLRIDEPWFNGHGGAASETRKQVAEALVTLLARDMSITLGELGFAHSSIAMHGAAGPQAVHDAIVLFDQVLGGARLTQPLFSDLAYFLDRLRKGAELAGEEALLDEMSVARLERWYRSLRPKAKGVELLPFTEQDERLIYAPGSVVGVRINGALLERRLIKQQLLALGTEEHLVYTYECGPGVTAIVPHDQIEPVGHEWRHILWDAKSDTLREIAA